MAKKQHSLKQSTVIGLLGGVAILGGMILLAPENIGAFLNGPGLLVVLGGTLAATLVCRPAADVRRVLRSIPELMSDERPIDNHDIDQLLSVAECYRYGNIRAAEQELALIKDPFLSSGIQLVLDGAPPHDISKVLQWHIDGTRTRERSDAQILRTMATFAPAFGMLGTLFGLVHMLHGLGESGLGQIGSAMGFAMITTLYGIVAANLFLKPLAIKKERRIEQQLIKMAISHEGILLLYNRQHPVIIKETLDAFLTHQQHQAGPMGKPALLEAS